MSVNEIMIIGNLTKDPTRGSAPNGNEVANFDVAVNEKIGGNEVSTFYRCAVWGDRSQSIMRYLHKGDKVLVRGRLTPSTYTTQNGETRVSLNISVRDCEFLVLKRREDGQQDNGAWKQQPVETDELPY